MKPVRTHTFSGVRYQIMFASEVDGFVDLPNEPRAVFINDNDTGRNVLDTVLHESIHILEPRISEAHVERLAAELTKFLWRLGYRRQEN